MNMRRLLCGVLLAVLGVSGCAMPGADRAATRAPIATLSPTTLPVATVASATAGPLRTPTLMPVAPTQTGTPAPAPTTVAADATALLSTTVATIAALDTLPLPRRDLVALALAYARTTSPARVARTAPLPDRVGTKAAFWVWDWTADSYYRTTATLQLALDHVLMYVEDDIAFDRAALDHSAHVFNDQVYPQTRQRFGSEWSPGIDGDPRITILNARIQGAGGYFSITDEVPRSANPFSNEREMFYMNVDSFPLGSDAYSGVLAHEFHHMIAMPQVTQSATWLNEGLAELARLVNGYPPTTPLTSFLHAPDRQLTAWGDKPDVSAAHYAAAFLFMAYLDEHYGAAIDFQHLIRAGAGKRLEVFAEQVRRVRPRLQSFDALFADWAVANVIDDPTVEDGYYSYAQLPAPVVPQVLSPTDVLTTVGQYAADYLLLPASDAPALLQFDGSDEVGVVAAQPLGQASWWSNRGDDAASTLTGQVDLRGLASASLHFLLWYDLQVDYDYGFVSASSDGGRTWRTLPGRYTTATNPAGANYGHGYTGISGSEQPEWREELIDLTAFAGRQVLIRFSVVTDEAVNRPGMLVDAIRIPELGVSEDAEQARTLWQAAGWVRIDNRLSQRWQLRLLRLAGGTSTQVRRVEQLALDKANRALVSLKAGEEGVLVVMATTPHTTERASYELIKVPAP